METCEKMQRCDKTPSHRLMAPAMNDLSFPTLCLKKGSASDCSFQIQQFVMSTACAHVVLFVFGFSGFPLGVLCNSEG